jgi:diguanylate cyclase (GGDEF)-like protein
VPLHPGISIGVAAFPADADDPSALFEAADRAMYRAKHGGKARVSR